MMAAANVVAEQGWRLVLIDDEDVDVAVVIEIAERNAAAGMHFGDGGSGLVEELLEFAAAQIPEEHVGCFVRCLGDLRWDFGIHHSGGQKQVGEAIVVEVDDAGAPTYMSSLHSEVRTLGHIAEIP